MKIKFERTVRMTIKQLEELYVLLSLNINKNYKYEDVFFGKYGKYYFRYNPTRWKLITILDVENV